MRLVAAVLGALLAFPALAQTPRPVTPTQGRPTPAAPVNPAPAAVAPPAVAPVSGTPVSGTPISGAPKVDVNAATAVQLDALPGIGPVRAAAIVAGRPYTDLQELVSKKVLSQGVLDGAKPRMALANINTSSEAELAKTLPGVGGVRAKAIVAGRPYAAPGDLVAKKVLPQGVYDKVKDLIAY